MALLKESAMNKLPEVSNSRPIGNSNRADDLLPLTKPTSPVPAKVVTTPDGVIKRITLFLLSETYTLFAESTATPCGSLKNAFMPVPSMKSAVPSPASVYTTPPGVILRIRLPSESETYMLSFESIANPLGPSNLAFVPVPSRYPPELPANVETIYWSLNT
jgi:hypothetical protein